MKKLEREVLAADRETVQSVLASIPDTDPVGRLSFQSRLTEIDDAIASLEKQYDTLGSVALLFAGQPVLGSRSIDADFSSRILGSFQDLVTKSIAADEMGSLGQRGPIPQRSAAALSITQLVRGSVGFVLEESVTNGELVDSRVKQAIDDVVTVIGKTASPSEEDFELAVEALDPRILVSLKGFFRTLDEENAVIRIVEEEEDHMLDAQAVHRGRQRVEQIEIEDDESDSIVGELLGILPDSKRFEMRLTSTGEIIRGRVAAAYAQQYLELIEGRDQAITGRNWRTKMKIREVRERNRPPRKLFTLLGLLERVQE